MTYYVGDDATITIPVTDTADPPGNLDFPPVVTARQWLGATQTIDAVWAGDPAATRDLVVPLSSLSAGLWSLRLQIADAADLFVGNVVLVDGGGTPTDGGTPGDDGGVSTDHGPIGATLTITQPGSHELDLTVNATVTVSTSGDVTLWVHGAGQTLTVAGQTFTIDDDAVILVVTSPRDVQSSYLAGGGSGVLDPGEPEDTTPPSAVTGLSATGGEEQVTFNWTAATDAESTVGYRYRVWLTSGGATGEYVTRSSVGPVTVTGLTAGGYTVQVYAYSSGGASATASATATVTAVPGWSVLASDDFTGTNGTMIKGRATPVGGLVWDGDTTPQIQSNAMKWASGVSDAGVVLPLTAAATADGVEVTMTPTLAGEGGGGAPRVEVTLSNTPAFVVEWASGAVSVKVMGYNSSSINTTLVPAENVTAGAPLTFRRVGSIIEALDDGVSVFTYDLAGGYSGYTIAPNSLLVIGYAFQNSSIDTFEARILT